MTPEQLELPWPQIEGCVGSRVRCTVDVGDYRRRMALAHEREFGWQGRLRAMGPFPTLGMLGEVTDIKLLTILDSGRLDEIPRIMVKFDGEIHARFMPPFVLEVLS